MTEDHALPSSWVVDCSAFMPLVFSDEDAAEIESLLFRAVNGDARLVVPSLFWYEVGNVLRMATVKKRITGEQADGALYRFTELPIETDGDLSPQIVLRINRFAAEHGLTMYDAAYFELADRHSARLLTADKKLLSLGKQHAWITRTVG